MACNTPSSPQLVSINVQSCIIFCTTTKAPLKLDPLWRDVDMRISSLLRHFYRIQLYSIPSHTTRLTVGFRQSLTQRNATQRNRIVTHRKTLRTPCRKKYAAVSLRHYYVIKNFTSIVMNRERKFSLMFLRRRRTYMIWLYIGRCDWLNLWAEGIRSAMIGSSLRSVAESVATRNGSYFLYGVLRCRYGVLRLFTQRLRYATALR